MARTVSLRDANQNFARYVREVEGGEEIVITRRGEPVAKLSAIRSDRRKLNLEQQEALARLLAAARNSTYRSDGPFSREDIYNERIDELWNRRKP